MTHRSLRFSIPAAVLASTFAFVTFGRVLQADAQVPNLPPITPAELLTKVSNADVPAFTGQVKLTSNLGLPNLDMFAGNTTPSSAVELFTGTRTATIAADGIDRLKVTMAGNASESSWIRNGADIWAWRSDMQSVKHSSAGSADIRKSVVEQSPDELMNPVQTAMQVLVSIAPTTTVSVRTSAYVADHAAYQLVLTPKSSVSTISEVILSVDAATGMPLETRIMSKGQTKPAMSVGFTSLTYETPPASTFVFTPPPGVTVEEVTSANDLFPLATDGGYSDGKSDSTTRSNEGLSGEGDGSGVEVGQSTTVGVGWDSVRVFEPSWNASSLETLAMGAKSVILANGESAKLLSTTLINVLFTDTGRIAIGAVNQAGLEAALTSVSATAVPATAVPTTSAA
jgi:outer membrane lipoprotein-sorting protein